MSDFAWRAEGIEKARDCGGLDLELRRRPGFTGQVELRAVSNWPEGASGGGASDPWVAHDPLPDWLPPSKAKKKGGKKW